MRVVGFLNVVGREELPSIEAPLIQDKEEGTYWILSTEPELVSEGDLITAELEERLTWIPEQVLVENGVIVIAEDHTDVEKGRALPAQSCIYTTRENATRVLDRLCKAYLYWGLRQLGSEDSGYATASDLIARAFRCRPDATALQILLWNDARLARDPIRESFELEGLRRTLARCLYRLPPVSGFIGSIRSVRIDCDARVTVIAFEGDDLFTLEHVPETVAVEILLNTIQYCSDRDHWVPVKDVILAVTIQVLLFGLFDKSSDMPETIKAKIANIHQKTTQFNLAIVIGGNHIEWPVTSLVEIITTGNDNYAVELSGFLLGAISLATNCHSISKWDRLISKMKMRDVQSAARRLALGTALVGINELLRDQPLSEIRNRSEMAKSAERLGRFQLMREQALRIIRLGTRINANPSAELIDHRTKNTLENIADACRQLGNWEMYRGSIEDAAAWYEKARQRFGSVIVSESDKSFGRVGERYAYCTLKLAQITDAHDLKQEAHSWYLRLEQWSAPLEMKISPSFRRASQIASNLASANDFKVGPQSLRWLATSEDPDTTAATNTFVGGLANVDRSRLRAAIAEIRRRVRLDPKDGARAAAELEDRVQNVSGLETYWIVARGFRLEGLVRSGGPAQVRLAGDLAGELVEFAGREKKGSQIETFASEQLAKYFQRLGRYRVANEWNERVLQVIQDDPAALMRRDIIRAHLVEGVGDASDVLNGLTSRARTATLEEAAQLWFAAGEVAFLNFKRWKVGKPTDVDLASIEMYFRRAIDSISPPHPAAVHRLAWIQFLRGENLSAAETLDVLQVSDARAAILYSKTVRKFGDQFRVRALERLAGAFKINPYDQLLVRALVDLAASDWVWGTSTCQHLIAEKLRNEETAAANVLASALAARSLFDDSIYNVIVAHFRQAGRFEPGLIAYLNGCMLRALEDTDERGASTQETTFNRDVHILDIAVPTKRLATTAVRALRMCNSGNIGPIGSRELSRPQQISSFMQDRRNIAAEWLASLSAVPPILLERSFNGIDLEIVNSTLFENHEHVTDSTQLDTVPGAIFVDTALLRGVLGVLSASKVVVDNDLESRQVVFDLTRATRDSPLNNALLEWTQYVIDDLFGGSLSQDASIIKLPLVVDGFGA